MSKNAKPNSIANKSKNFLESQLKMIDSMLEKENTFTNVLGLIEKKIGIKKQHSFFAMVVIMASYIICGQGSNFILYLIGFAYPAFKSIKAIESTNKDDDTKWLTYWVTTGTIGLLEYFTDIVFFWIPMYNIFKLIFLAYLMAPIENNGSMFIYKSIIRPFFLKHEKKLTKEVSNIAKAAGSAISQVKDATTDFVVNQNGVKLGKQQEQFLVAKFSNGHPLFITHFPKSIKPFYAKLSGNNTETFDILFPNIGELCGASLRENNFKVLSEKLKSQNMNRKGYLNNVQCGLVPHGGFGIGFERLLMYITGIENIRDTVIYPRYFGHCDS
ncbi:Receptor expression-enhancing protein 6 [Intoshia linei]|uniref:Receptor expression-enhancing protein 6 n=1 Tax=Intoshia linei TaxID=1819745 RepID=A0A177AS51_9BILA|nr:Receptor expression-enhancing protein 6 [Intoshia linei]